MQVQVICHGLILLQFVCRYSFNQPCRIAEVQHGEKHRPCRAAIRQPDGKREAGKEIHGVQLLPRGKGAPPFPLAAT